MAFFSIEKSRVLTRKSAKGFTILKKKAGRSPPFSFLPYFRPDQSSREIPMKI